MNLILFSNFFPYQKSEPFLENEFSVTRHYAEHISLFTLYGNSEYCRIKSDTGIELFKPIYLSASDKKQLFIKGIFNLAPCHLHVKEFFTKKLFLSPAKTYWHLVSMLVTRSVMASEAYKNLLKQLKLKPETVLYFYWGDNLCWILPYLKNKVEAQKIKTVIRLHGSDLYENIKANHAPLRSLIFKYADLICPVSENGKNYLAEKYPSFKHKINVARLGVADFGLNPIASTEQKTVVSVSNLVPLKRVHLIFEALQKTNGHIVWHHFGSGPLLADLQNLSSKARPDLQIKWHGLVNNAELMRFYQNNQVSVFVNTSESEGLPVSIMEAFSFGIPAIATNVGGVAELVNAENGYLLDKNFEIAQLSSAIENILNTTPPKIQELRNKARTSYLDKVSINNYHRFYKNLGNM